MIVIKHNVTGTRQIVDSLDGVDVAVWTQTADAAPADLKERPCVFDDAGCRPAPQRLTAAEAVALYTATEKPRIVTSGQSNVRDLLIALVLFDGVQLGSVEHVQGTALLDGLGLLDGPGRAARIVAGMPPL